MLSWEPGTVPPALGGRRARGCRTEVGVLAGYASDSQDAAMGAGLWLFCPGAALLPGFREEKTSAPKERYLLLFLDSLLPLDTLSSASLPGLVTRRGRSWTESLGRREQDWPGRCMGSPPGGLGWAGGRVGGGAHV